MKKLALLLTLVMVLGLGASAMAATTTSFSGKVVFSTDDILADTITWNNTYRLNVNGTISDNSGFAIRLENGTIDVQEEDDKNPDTTADVSKVAVGALLKRANYWTKTPVGKVVVGLQFEDFSQLSANYAGDNLAASFTGVGFYPTIAKDVTAFAFYNPSKKEFGAQAKYAASFATFAAGASKADGADLKLAVSASVPVIKDKLSVYGQFDSKGTDEKYVGATGSVAGFDVTGEYAVDAKAWSVDVVKTIHDVEFDATYASDKTLYFGTTLYF